MPEHARVLFFATLRDKAGVKETTLEFEAGTHIAEIKTMVVEKFPAMKQAMESVIVALNHEFAFDEDPVPNEAEIAMFPPVSGGANDAGGQPTILAITERELDVNAIVSQVTTPTTGGICIFTGTVRGITERGEAHQTIQLEYEAYQGMAEQKLAQISQEIRQKWPEVEGIALVQRTGTLLPGAISVIVACSSSHRDEGIFAAARYGIDRLKEIVPIWKKEISPSGEVWVEGEYHPHRGE